MPILYNGFSIVPAPLVDRQIEKVKSRSGTTLGYRQTMTLSGKLVAYKGSPNSSGAFSANPADENIASDGRLGSILTKQQALINLFGSENKLLEIISPDGVKKKTYVAHSPRISFSPGPWHDVCDYTIALELRESVDTSPLIESASETWSMETQDEAKGVYRLSHTMNASARDNYSAAGALIKKGWENAKDYVHGTIGLGIDNTRMQAPDVLDASSLKAYNYNRNVQVDEIEGTYSVTENWLCYDPGAEPPAIDDYTVNVRTGFRTNSNEPTTTVTVEGTITGLEVRNNTTRALTSSRWTNAKDKWDNHVKNSLYSRANALAGVALSSTAENSQVGFNTVNGTVTYSSEFTNRPSNAYGAYRYSVRVTDNNQGDAYATIPILARSYGPILQPTYSKTPRRRSLSISMEFRANNPTDTFGKPNTSGIVNANRPQGYSCFVDQDEESWDEVNWTYSRQVTWTWEA